MNYTTGEQPMRGDTVSDDTEREGVVAHLIYQGNELSELAIRWNDGTLGIRHYPDEDAFLGRLSNSKECGRNRLTPEYAAIKFRGRQKR
jgi:hypothetical protein